jgi:hypothetical protein
LPAPYYVLVEGGHTPKKAHADLERARSEAKRLFELYGGSRWSRVLETAEELESTHVAFERRDGTEKRVPKVKFKRRWNLEPAQS